MRVNVNVTTEIALEEGRTYAGGLGVLEGDKFYASGELGINYLVLMLFYRNGYVDYRFSEDGSPTPVPQSQPIEFTKKLKKEDRFPIELKGGKVIVEPLSYRYKTAKTVFFNPVQPSWAVELVDQLYVEKHYEEKFYKYVLLAKAAAEYVKSRVGLSNVNKIILNEAYTALLPLVLRAPSKYIFIIHTPGPWSHPIFPTRLFEREFGFKFITDKVALTDIGLATSFKTYCVSEKHFEIMQKIVPHFAHKLSYMTNGINILRWINPRLKRLLEENVLNVDSLKKAKHQAREKLLRLIKSYKAINGEEKPIILWCRRITGYKRPFFVTRFIEEENPDAIIVVAGKAHPYDVDGLRYMQKFYQYFKEKPNVVYIHNYDVSKAKILLSGGDLLLFTPFSSLEACGTSFMKAAINSVPSLSSRDGGVLELVEDGINGWLFGRDLRQLIYFDTQERDRINEEDYREFKAKLLRILDLIANNEDKYYEVALNCVKTFMPKVDICEKMRQLVCQ
ncbi:MAG: glycosyl transferase family 1 [Thermoprotei archaeon]|nr:MAG: glycosyl transferase family 1 [Thermoprotei archaeon]